MTKLELVKAKMKKISPKDLDAFDDFIEKLITEKDVNGKRKMKLNLGGALKELSKEYTSVELQHSNGVDGSRRIKLQEKIIVSCRFKYLAGILIKSAKGK